MKNATIITALAALVGLLAACSGDRTPQTGKDSVKNTYKVSKDTSNTDTGKTTSADNSGSGGTGIVKDTSKQAEPKK
jgi:hypothetical protein